MTLRLVQGATTPEVNHVELIVVAGVARLGTCIMQWLQRMVGYNLWFAEFCSRVLVP